MQLKSIFVDVKHRGQMVNSSSDYDEYVVRCGLASGRYVHSDSLIVKRFKGVINGVSAKQQAQDFVDKARKTLEPQEFPTSAPAEKTAAAPAAKADVPAAKNKRGAA